MKSTASALWQGDLKSGNGKISAQSKAFENIAYSFKTRFEGEAGTTPEELIAAAHAGCFSMAFSNELAGADMNPESVSTEATVTLEVGDNGPEVTAVHLVVTANVPDADHHEFEKLALGAKQNCPISKLLNADITMETNLNS